MRRLRRFALLVAALFLATGVALAQGLRPPTSGSSKPAAPRSDTDKPEAEQKPKSKGVTVRIGALLPLSGSAAWFGKELRQGMELAIADLEPGGQRAATRLVVDRRDEPAPPRLVLDRREDDEVEVAAPPERPIRLTLETAEALPANPKQITEAFGRIASGTPVVFTASPTPTLAVQPLTSGRDVLLIHLGLPTGRLTAGSRTLLLARPPIQARVASLISLAAQQQVRRLALLAGGDEFGKTVRAALTAAWRERGMTLVHDESVMLDSGDLSSRLRALVRATPEAVVLGFQGAEAGELAVRLREARYAGPIVLLDDDQAALLAGGPALEGALVIGDAFKPEFGSAGARFARVYEEKFGSAPTRHAALAYDAVMLVAAGLRQARVRGSVSGAKLREAMVAAPPIPSVYGDLIRVRDDGTVSRPLVLFRVDKGALTFIRLVTPAGSG
jgi:branched-chain amino acid transport system substrate-binding protein